MHDLKKIRVEKQRWMKEKEKIAKDRRFQFVTTSSTPVELLNTPDDLEGMDYLTELGFPGEYPFTRGIRHNMYRGKLWTMRQFAGFGTPKQSNERYKFLLERGQTGLSVAFDLPTLMGRDADDIHSEGEVGQCGVSISSLRDMEILFDGIPLDQVSTSMTINSPAAILLAFYICVAEKQGVSSVQLRGTLQNDILKEYIAQKEWIFPPQPSMRIITDLVQFCTEKVPQWNTISISGYHIREAGSTAVQELAFTLADGFAYVEACIKTGMNVDDFAPRFSFFWNSHLDFFEEVAKFRAGRRIWARHMKERYHAKKKDSWLCRFHTQTAGCSLTAQQPENNIVRTAYQALAAVLGGTQSLHTNSMDETLALPSEKAVKIALRTQQLMAYETGVAYPIDPLGGSYFIEQLTNRMEAGAEDYFKKIDSLGGVIPAIEKGFFQREIADAAYLYQREIEAKDRIIVGVNDFTEPDEKIEIPILRIDEQVEIGQRVAITALKKERNEKQVAQALDRLRTSARDGSNLMPRFIECAKAYATLGEMIQVLRVEFGEYDEPPSF